ncbi:MAG: transposase [Lachnospiraceae bacterium]|nr:transposase [Lachnospiraceae bacterium]
MSELSISELEFIIKRVLQNANEAVEEDDKSDFSYGKRLAYYEILDTIKNECIARDVDLNSLGLDIVLEKFA